MEQEIYNLYNSPQSGGLLPVFQGYKRHLSGGGLFGTIARFALPILKTIGKHALGVVSRGANEYLSGNKGFKQAMGDELRDEAINLAKGGVRQVIKRRRRRQSGKGLTKRRKKSINKGIFN